MRRDQNLFVCVFRNEIVVFGMPDPIDWDRLCIIPAPFYWIYNEAEVKKINFFHSNSFEQ